jgi:MFS family permease
MVFAFGSVAIANWVLYTWLADHLYQRFHKSLEEAGFSSTFYLQAASLVGILLGGWLADRWSSATPRGRVRTQGAGLLLAAGALFLAGVADSEDLLLGCLVLVGFGKGFYDCNTMPVLCQIARPDLRSTGYGVFNLIGCLAGGAATALTGAWKERIGLGMVLQVAALLLFVSAIALWRLRLPVSANTENERSPDDTAENTLLPTEGVHSA